MGLGRLAVVTGVVLLAINGVWADSPKSTKTSGLTNVQVIKGTTGTQTWYEFTLINNSDPLHPYVDCGTPPQEYLILSDQLDIFRNGGDWIPDSTSVPSNEWSWTGTGFQRFADDSSLKYYVPPSAGPDSSVTGFKYWFDSDPGVALTELSFTTHVLAVKPEFEVVIKNDQLRDKYTGISVCLPGYGPDNPTWFDAPGPKPQVPEASSLLLGAMGMLGPVGYALRRRTR